MSTSYSGQGINLGNLIADVDMNSHQFKFVTTASTAGSFKLATGGSGPAPLGVLQDDPRAGEPGNIRVFGTSKVSASGAIGFGDFVVAGSHGLAVVQTAASAAVQGVALTALASGGGYVEVLLTPLAVFSTDNTP